MKRKFLTLVGIAATSLWSIANATTVTYTYDFGTGGAGTTIASPDSAASTPAGGPTIKVYGESTPTGLTGGADDGGPSEFGTNGTNGVMSLFSVTNGVGGNSGSGIAPFDNGTSYTLQNGITEQQVVLLDLTKVAAGSTISFVMSTGAQATANTGINVWTGAPTGTPLGIGTGWAGQTASNSLTTESIVGANVNGAGGGAATKSFTLFTSNSPANEWIAIQADCHYLLLDTLTITSPSGVPEPSFYGFFALAMVGLVFGARKLRARAAAEQA